MKRIILFPYKMASESSKTLAESLREKGQSVLRVYPDRNYRPKTNDVIINWGNSKYPEWTGTMLNSPYAVSLAVDKLKSFHLFKQYGVRTPEWTRNKNVAKSWDGIIARTVLNGHSGDGLYYSSKYAMIDAPLYVRVIDFDSEYRVHIFNGEVIDYVKKTSADNERGWVGVRNIDRIEENELLAIKAVKALGLDFGAVDIIRKDGVSYVLEVNTACGMMNTTTDLYTNEIIKYATY